MERLHGLEVWNRTKTLSVMTKKDWFSIHDEVKEAETLKATVMVWVLGWKKIKRGKTLTALSFLLIIYIYTYILHCENKRLLNACMVEMECVYLLKVNF